MLVGSGAIIEAMVHSSLGFAMLLRDFTVIVQLLVCLLYKLLLVFDAMLDVLLEAVVLPTPFVVGILPRRGIEGLPILG